MALYSLSMDEVDVLEAQTHPSRKQLFKDHKYDWTLAKAQLESFSVVVDIIEAADPSPQKDEKANNILKQIKVLNKEKESLEEKMKQLAISDDSNTVNFPMLEEFGTTNFLTKDEHGRVMKFHPGKTIYFTVGFLALGKGETFANLPHLNHL